MFAYIPRRRRLRQLYSTFPSGLPGIGLLLLRVTLGLILLFQSYVSVLGTGRASYNLWVPAILASVTGIFFILGFLTPLAGLFTLCAGTALQLLQPTWDPYFGGLPGLNLFVMATTITFVGPGAFSLDARLFGHRKIIVPRLNNS
jgi:uncharacterized membrane protein YphA (DoxX/SURF4 family)